MARLTVGGASVPDDDEVAQATEDEKLAEWNRDFDAQKERERDEYLRDRVNSEKAAKLPDGHAETKRPARKPSTRKAAVKRKASTKR